MKNYKIGVKYFIKKIKKKKVLMISNLNQDKKILNFILQFLIKKNRLHIQKKRKILSENFLPEKLNSFFFQSFFHQEIFFEKDKNSKNFVFGILQNYLNMKKYSNSYKIKILIIFNGIENLTILEQEQLFSMIHKMRENFWIVLNIYKIENVLEIFDKFYFFSIDIFINFQKKQKTKLCKKKLTKCIFSKDVAKFSNLWWEKIFNFFFFFFFKKNFKENVAYKNSRDFSYPFFINLEFFRKMIKSNYSENIEKIQKKNQSEIFFFDELYFSKNLLFEQKNS